MSWKQPLDTGLKNVLESDKPALTLFILLMLDASNSDQVFEIGTGKGFSQVQLKRGQVLYGRFKYQKHFLLKPTQTQKVDRILSRLQKIHRLINRETFPTYSVVTINNYDELVKINSQVNMEHTTNKQAINTHKNVKNVKSENTEASSNEMPEISDKDIEVLSQRLGITPEGILSYYKKIKDYEESTGKKYKNYPKTIEIWVGRLKEKGGIQL